MVGIRGAHRTGLGTDQVLNCRVEFELSARSGLGANPSMVEERGAQPGGVSNRSSYARGVKGEG